MPLRPLRDVDTAGRARWLRAFGWAVFPGFFIGLAVAARVADTWGVCDPEPSLRLARLLRDDADRLDEALAWFRAARAAERIRPARAAAVGREIVELLEKQGDLPAALTELARLADLHEGTPTGRWADDERRRLKALWLERTES